MSFQITSPTPEKDLTVSGKLQNLGKIGGGTYGRVYNACKVDLVGPNNVPPNLPINPSNNLIYPISIYSQANNPGLLNSNRLIIPTTSMPALGGIPLPVKLSQGPQFKPADSGNPNSQMVAVKRNFISPTLRESIGSLRELDLLQLVRKHPYCIEIQHVAFQQPFVGSILSPDAKDQVSDKVYFVLEKGDLDGENYIHPSIPINYPPVNQRKLFALHLLLSIEFLHSRMVYHRDIKPSNIIVFLNPDGSLSRAKLTDFGLAAYYCSQNISQPNFVTLWYRAPEICLQKQYDFKVDVWSCGCILFELFSNNNERFVQGDRDEDILSALVGKLPFPYDDYILAKNYYGSRMSANYEREQTRLVSMKQRLNCPESLISQFNSGKIGNRPNFGNFDQFVSVLDKMLMINPESRSSVSQILNMPFFDGYRDMINGTRTSFGINSEGQWILKPLATLNYIQTKVRERGMKWFQLIYSNRMNAPVCNWYSHRILFHAMEMFDRYCLTINPDDKTPESDIVIWVNTFLFISSKYFRVMVGEIGLDNYCIGIHPEEFGIFRNRVHQFEEEVIQSVFKIKIYMPTFYETVDEFLTETSVYYLVKLYAEGQIAPGTSLSLIWSAYRDQLAELNRKPSVHSDNNTPIVSLIHT